MHYETVIGLEIHAELSTHRKAFCSCENAYGAPPNTLCCPVCAGLPGALPVLNQRVVDDAVKMGFALNCSIVRVSQFARKHYFYPDLPKGYQISQHEFPLCKNGKLDVWIGKERKSFGIERIHIEEDAGKMVQNRENGYLQVDYNRSGVPLIEIVTRPDMRSADEAKAAMEGIAQILRSLGISNVKMQEGNLRADVNVSLRPFGQTAYGTRCELKNVNSFMAVHRAILHESARQACILQAGGNIRQETRRWDDASGESFLLRSKENAEDYRYFPEPDLGFLVLDEKRLSRLKAEIPELPLAKIERYKEEYRLPLPDAVLLCAEPWRCAFFEASLALAPVPPKTLANWLLGDVGKALNARKKNVEQTHISPEGLGELLMLVEEGVLSGTAAKQVLEVMMDTPAAPRQVVKELGLEQISDETSIFRIVWQMLALQPEALADYLAGEKNAFGYLMGLCMKESGGRANPTILRQVLEQAIAAQSAENE